MGFKKMIRTMLPTMMKFRQGGLDGARMRKTAVRPGTLELKRDLKHVDHNEEYQMHCFDQKLLVPIPFQKLRYIAKTHNLKHTEVEAIHKQFVMFDRDASGTLDYFEFRSLIAKCLRIDEAELPDSKARFFW